MKSNQKEIILKIVGLFVFLSLIFIFYDFLVIPDEVQLERIEVLHPTIVEERKAERLVGQDFVEDKGVWASKGYNLYFRDLDGYKFKKAGHIPVSFGQRLAGNSRILRYLTGNYDLMELKELKSGTLLVFTADSLYRRQDDEEDFEQVMNLNNSRKVKPQGYTETEEGNIYWAENLETNSSNNIKIWKSEDDGKNWEDVHEFSTQEIDNINLVQYDSYADKIWIGTGGEDSEVKIGYLDNNEFEVIGSGGQKWNTVTLVFSEDNIYWGMKDTDSLNSQHSIWKWNRDTEEEEMVRKTDSAVYYGTKRNDIIIFTTSGSNEASLYLTRDGKNWFEGANWPLTRKYSTGNLPVIPGEQISNDPELFYLSRFNIDNRGYELIQISNFK